MYTTDSKSCLRTVLLGLALVVVAVSVATSVTTAIVLGIGGFKALPDVGFKRWLPRPMQQQLGGVQTELEQQSIANQQQQGSQGQQASAYAAAVEPPDNSWPDHLDDSGNTCRGGFLHAPRQLFWAYNDDKTPGLTDVIHSGDRIYALFSMKLAEPYFSQWTFAVQGNWSMEFLDAPLAGFKAAAVKADNLGRDAHRHTFTIFTSLPKQLLDHPRNQSIRVNIEGRHQNLTKRYENVPLCLYPDQEPSQYRHLIACTEITAQDAKLVPEWVVYHTLQGFEHFHMYINDKLDLVRRDLEPLVKAGLVTVIDWQWAPHHYGGHAYQQAEQNGCLVRARGRARWVGLNDVDEFYQVLAPNMTVGGYLNQKSDLEHVGSLIARSVWWGSNTNASLQANFTQHGKGLVLGQYVSRAECCEGQKMIANPRGMSYNSVHGITTGGVEHPFDATSELRINHFKHQRQFNVVDLSLSAHVGAIESRLEELGYPVQ